MSAWAATNVGNMVQIPLNTKYSLAFDGSVVTLYIYWLYFVSAHHPDPFLLPSTKMPLHSRNSGADKPSTWKSAFGYGVNIALERDLIIMIIEI